MAVNAGIIGRSSGFFGGMTLAMHSQTGWHSIYLNGYSSRLTPQSWLYSHRYMYSKHAGRL